VRPPVRALLLGLTVSMVFLTTAQCLRPLARAASEIPAAARQASSTTIHVREEVADSGIDLSIEGSYERVAALPEVALSSPNPPQVAEVAEIEVSPPHRFLHRRVAPSSSDDGFHIA